jgi:hypothetical protein
MPFSALGFNKASFRVPAIDEGFLFWGVANSFGVVKTIDAVLWENSNYFHARD